MEKERIILNPGRTFHEFGLLPGYTSARCTIQDINLETRLHEDLVLKIPLLSAAMTSVTGYDMALALGKEGGLGVLPMRLPIEEQVKIVRKIKSNEMSFVEEPVSVRETNTIEEVIRKIKEFGHSTIPVTDRNNVFLGMFTEQHYWQTNARLSDNVQNAMIKTGSKKIIYSDNQCISIEEAKRLLELNKKDYLVVLDDLGRLVKLAFKKDIEQINVGAAVSTHKGWENRVEANVDAGVDLIVIDTSDAYNAFTEQFIKKYKKDMGIKVPLFAGNVVTYEGVLFLMNLGADIVKVGMSSGSICSTKREKAVGRAPMTALLEADRARKTYFKQNKIYVPLIVDGGVANAADMIIALTRADAIMMGNYFNKFFEAAGEKLDENGKVTTDVNKMYYVATWGEGSERAQNLDRYEHSSMKTFFPEGVESTVNYAGRLKPNLKIDLMKIRSALSNAGCKNLEDYRKNSVLELLSVESGHIVSDVHDINVRR